MRLTAITAFVCAVLAASLIGCGSSTNTSAPSPQPTATSTTPSGGTGSSSGGTGSGGGGTSPSSSPDNYQASIFYLQGNSNAPQGMLTVDASANNGSGAIQIPANNTGVRTFTLNFLPFAQTQSLAFMKIGTFTSDSSGGVNMTFQFPSKGAFAGFFEMDLQTASGPSQYYEAGPNPFDPNLSYQAPLLPASTIFGGVGESAGTASGSGSVSLTSASAQMKIAGTAATHTFTVSWCGAPQHCVNLGVLITDAQGSASGTFSMNGTSTGGSFLLSDSAGAEFISGFRVQ